jgi:hypothetical protein
MSAACAKQRVVDGQDRQPCANMSRDHRGMAQRAA